MAQPLFTQHPLQNYFKDVGESAEIMPGGHEDFIPDPNSDHELRSFEDFGDGNLLPTPISTALQTIRAVLSSAYMPSQTSSFVERFKYDVISSSLLTTSVVSSPHASGRHSRTPTVPGRLTPDEIADRSPAHRLPDGPPSRPEVGPSRKSSSATTSLEDSWPMTLAFAVIIALFSCEYFLSAALLLGITLYMKYHDDSDISSKPSITSSLDSLNDLTIAGDVWNSVVHEAVTVLETDERSILHGPSSPTSPSSSLRVALHSSLHTTQTQCDNVRRLFSALTAPAELSQLSEMYAPPSPGKPAFSDFYDMPRPLSLPDSPSRSRTISVPSEVKRSTWNGSYAYLANAGSPVLKHREKRRSDINSLLELSSPKRSVVSAPVTPAPATHSLTGVQEEEDAAEKPGVPHSPKTSEHLSDQVSFGIAALDLQRKRVLSGLESFGITSSAGFSTSRHGPPTMSSASRFTRMQTTRHPLSLSALHHALQGAIASKRYTCAHLLALRFDEGEDEGYWEDVRSVMALLTTTFADASSRLADALDQAEREKLMDQNPGADSLLERTRSRSGSVSNKVSTNALATLTKMMSSHSASTSDSGPTTFAPVPTHLSRFAAHVDAISTALNDAREYLESCVASLDESSQNTRTPSLPPSPSPAPPIQEAPPLRAYERLRRELGLALRECERGREPLLDILAPHYRSHHRPASDEATSDTYDLPALGHDLCSDDSDKQGSSPVFDNNVSPGTDYAIVRTASGEDEDDARDDVTAHLLLTTSSQHLPPPGIEQVFEAESGGGVLFSRERSTLTREERIMLAKAKRESGGFRFPSGPVEPPAHVERWGPGGDVVQELKDVIWKVGERRRKLTDGQYLRSVVADWSDQLAELH